MEHKSYAHTHAYATYVYTISSEPIDVSYDIIEAPTTVVVAGIYTLLGG